MRTGILILFLATFLTGQNMEPSINKLTTKAKSNPIQVKMLRQLLENEAKQHPLLIGLNIVKINTLYNVALSNSEKRTKQEWINSHIDSIKVLSTTWLKDIKNSIENKPEINKYSQSYARVINQINSGLKTLELQTQNKSSKIIVGLNKALSPQEKIMTYALANFYLQSNDSVPNYKTANLNIYNKSKLFKKEAILNEMNQVLNSNNVGERFNFATIIKNWFLFTGVDIKVLENYIVKLANSDKIELSNLKNIVNRIHFNGTLSSGIFHFSHNIPTVKHLSVEVPYNLSFEGIGLGLDVGISFDFKQEPGLFSSIQLGIGFTNLNSSKVTHKDLEIKNFIVERKSGQGKWEQFSQVENIETEEFNYNLTNFYILTPVYAYNGWLIAEMGAELNYLTASINTRYYQFYYKDYYINVNGKLVYDTTIITSPRKMGKGKHKIDDTYLLPVLGLKINYWKAIQIGFYGSFNYLKAGISLKI